MFGNDKIVIWQKIESFQNNGQKLIIRERCFSSCHKNETKKNSEEFMGSQDFFPILGLWSLSRVLIQLQILIVFKIYTRKFGREI